MKSKARKCRGCGKREKRQESFWQGLCPSCCKLNTIDCLRPKEVEVRRIETYAPEAIYCDGGTISKNPSDVGGTWAYCWTNGLDIIRQESGVITNEEAGQRVTSNYAELLAAYNALSSVPDDWRGTIYTDSVVTFYRLNKSSSFVGIPIELEIKVLRRRLRRKYKVSLIKGHPTSLDLINGKTANHVPVPSHNVLCHQLCGMEAKNFLKARKTAKA